MAQGLAAREIAMRTLLLLGALLALAPLAAADVPDLVDVPTVDNHNFLACAQTHIGYFMASGNPIHLTHPVAPCFLHG